MVIGILVFAAWLRLSNLDLIEFKRDEVNHLQLSADFLAHPRVLAVGSESSVGIDKPPFMVYLMTIPLVVSRDPRVATGFVALLNLGAVAGCYVLTRRYFGRTAALVAALLFGVSPWAVFFSRKIFTANLFPPFTVLFFLALFGAVVDRRPWQWVWTFVWLAALLQLNFFAISYVPLLALALVIYRDRVRLPAILVGAAVFTLLFVPYLYADYAHGWVNLRGLFDTARGTSRIDLDAFRLALRAIGGEDLSALAGISIKQYQAQRLKLGWLDTVEAGLFLAGLAYVVVLGLILAAPQPRESRLQPVGKSRARALIPRRNRTFGWHQNPHMALLALWFAVPVLFNTRHSVELYLHYFPLLYPVQFIVIGVLIANVTRLVENLRLPRLARWAGCGLPLALLGAISLWQVYHITFFFNFVDHNATDMGYDTPIKYHITVAQATRNLSRDRAEASLVILGDDVRPGNSDLLSALTYLIGPDVKLRYLDADRLSLLFPAGSKETIFLVPPGDPPAAGLLAGRTRQLPESTVILPGGSAAFRFYQGSANQALTDQPGFPVRLGPGIRVLGYTIEPGEGCRERSLTSASSPLAHCILQLVITWQVLDTSAAPANPSFFNHLVDESGRKVSQHDGLDYPPRRWTNGDIFVSRYDLSLPANAAPGRYWILTGLYDYKTGVRQPAETEGGDALGDAVRLGPTMFPCPLR